MAKTCPYLREPCIQHQCELFIHVIGPDPQTGAMTDRWGCAHAFMPLLTIENSQQQRQTAAAVESFRNEVVQAKRHDQIIDAGRVLHAIEGGR